MLRPIPILLLAVVACRHASAPPQDDFIEVVPPSQEPDITSTPEGHPVLAQLTNAPEVPARIFRKHPAHVIVELTVNEVEKEIAPGVRYTFWTFGGQVPGKFIRVRQGDVVEVHLKNDPSNKLPHNIDLHAVTGPGGGAASTFTAPGHESSFTFRATEPGLYVYHCATAPVPMHVANGMYGMILVEPPGGFPPVSHEYYVMQGELYTAGKYHAPGLQTFDMEKGIDERPTYVVFDGAEGSLLGDKALTAKTGDTIRIFFGNAGPNLDANFHIIGTIFDRVYPEGGSLAQEHVQTTLVPAGGATIVELHVDVPGSYALVDHALFRAFNKGAVGQLRVDGPSRTDLMTQKQGDVAYAGGPIEAPPIDTAGDPVLQMGEGTFGRICAACHQPSGLGIPGQFPPLAQSDYLAASPKERIIDHVLHGLQGPVTVRGTTYNGQMPPLGFLSDDEIAAVLTYVRASFGNHLSAVSSDEVAKVRGRTASLP
ncbi:MAG TPA: copper-containing nitrite reductase [Kofleriaceae bacterium]|nr:copper-containing nitrite reductase [Kofleriaceae bacterium]